MTPDERLASVETRVQDLKETMVSGFERIEKSNEKTIDHLRTMHEKHFEEAKKQGEKLIELTGMCNNAMLVANGAMSEAKQGAVSLQTHKDNHAKWNKIAGISAAGLTGTGGALAALKDVIKSWLQ